MTSEPGNGVEWISKPDKGAASELIASAYLLSRGFAVFRSVSPTCPCDLIVMIGDSLLRVEVKSLFWYKGTSPGFAWPTNDKWDRLLVVATDTFKVYEFEKGDPDTIKDKMREYLGLTPAIRHVHSSEV